VWPESERQCLARELHDVVSHTIAAINLQAGVALHVLADAPERAADSLQAIRATSQDALHELRAILDELQGSDDREPLRLPLVPRLERLAERASRAGVATRLHISGAERQLLPAVSQAVYRVVQESLTNVLRHSGATAAEISLAFEDDLVVEIRDNGAATNAGGSSGSGLGIAGMRARIEDLGGLLVAGRRPGAGFRVRARLPERSAA
jgi:signal transduction histidine kinase